MEQALAEAYTGLVHGIESAPMTLLRLGVGGVLVSFLAASCVFMPPLESYCHRPSGPVERLGTDDTLAALRAPDVRTINRWRAVGAVGTTVLYASILATLGVAAAWIVALADDPAQQPGTPLLLALVVSVGTGTLVAVAGELARDHAARLVSRALKRERPACADGLGVISGSK